MRQRRFLAGFTLLELLVAVAILSATALAAFGLASEDRAQIRYEDTNTRLRILRRALVGMSHPAWGGDIRLSGYVVDNGRLPEIGHGLKALLERPRQDANIYAEQGERQAVFRAVLDTACYQVAGAPVDLGAAAILFKGHRGNYLAGSVENGAFRDGWGNVGLDDDEINFGWSYTAHDTTGVDGVILKSLGADNADREPGAPVEQDQAMELLDADWRVPLAGWQVTLRNRNTAVGGFGEIHTGDMRAVLLVFENSLAGGRWRQFQSMESCPAMLAAGAECALVFTAAHPCDGADLALVKAEAPMGRHLLLLRDHVDPYTAFDSRYRVAQVDFYPGALPPRVVWDLY